MSFIFYGFGLSFSILYKPSIGTHMLRECTNQVNYIIDPVSWLHSIFSQPKLNEVAGRDVPLESSELGHNEKLELQNVNPIGCWN